MNRNKKLFVLDLDGTALGGGFTPYARFPDHFSAFLDDLNRRGWLWAINTSWDPEGQLNLVKDSAVISRPAFLMGEYGRKLIKVENNHLIPLDDYNLKIEHQVLSFSRQVMLPIITELCDNFNPQRLLFHGHLLHFILAEPKDSVKFNSLTMKYHHNPQLKVSYSELELSIRPAFLNKGLPLKELIASYGFSPENIVVAGDEIPDIDMMSPIYSRYYICPANAVEKVQQHVNTHHGKVGNTSYAAGIIDAFNQLKLQ